MIPTKTCASCGRPFTMRKAWERDWADVRYCSKGCRRTRPNATDLALEAALLDALRTRGEVPTDDAARTVGGDAWQGLVERARRAARRLAADGRAELVQGGRPVGPNSKGSFAVRRAKG